MARRVSARRVYKEHEGKKDGEKKKEIIIGVWGGPGVGRNAGGKGAEKGLRQRRRWAGQRVWE